MSQLGSHNERESIRPSLADLSDANFFEKLEAEANQLRNSQHSIHHNVNALPSIPSTRQKAEGSTPPTKKSRFAQQRQAELQASNDLDDHLPVPTGRFVLDLDPEKEEHPHLPQTEKPANPVKTRLMADITERYGQAEPNNFFNSKFSSDSFLETNHLYSDSSNKSQRTTGLSAQASMPPWELRHLASRSSSQKSRETLSCQDNLPVTQPPNCSNASPLSSTTKSFSSTEKQQISSENESLLAQMSHDEILQEQAALKAHLMQSNPELLTKLLTKFNIKPPANDTPTETPPPPTPTLRKQKQVRYAEEEDVIPSGLSPFATENLPCVANEDDKIPFVTTKKDSLESHPLMFDWNGVRVFDGGDAHASVNDPSDDGIHIHQTSSAFTFKQLLRLILSSVPAQRIMGLKILNQIVVRYFENSTHEMNDAEMTLLAQEFGNAAFDIIIVASKATRERNLGIATTALILLDSILSKARIAQTSTSKYKCIVQPTWIEHILTQTTLLADFHSQFEHQGLPRPSMTSIVRILCGMVILGDSSKVSEEILKRSSFLELIIQVLVAVPWPMNSQPPSEIPDLAAFELLLAISKSSRACSRSILDRGLMTPMLRFIGLPYWNFIGVADEAAQIVTTVPNDRIMGVLINSMGFQFDLMTVFASYGLGTSLRTTLDPLLRTTTVGLVKILETSLCANSSTSSFVTDQQFNLISSYLKLLQSWMRCADDPHFSDPPHSINWSQVTEWESSILDFLRLSSMPSPHPPGMSNVLGSACALIALYLEVSFKKKLNISNCLATLESLIPQLRSVFQAVVDTLLQGCFDHQKFFRPNISECELLINLAKLKNCLTRISTENENQPILKFGILEHEFPDEAFALGCRAAFEYEELSLLPWALSVLHLKHETKSNLDKILLAGLFVRNSDGAIVSEILAESFRQCQTRIQYECQISDQQTVQEDISPQLSQLLPIFMDYIHSSGTSTHVSEPSPHQIKDQLSQNDKPAFLLPSNWPLLAITFLKPEHLTSSTGSRSSDTVRASYALTVVLQSSLNDLQTQFPSLSDIFTRFLLDRYSLWKSVMGSVLAINSQAYWSSSDTSTSEKIWNSIFEDPVCSQLIIRLIKIAPLYPTRLTKSQHDIGVKQKSETSKAQESEEAELFTIFTDILAIYDSSSLDTNLTFMKILTPFLSMSRAREFRGILFNDHTHILKNMLQVSLEDVIDVDNSCSDDDTFMEKYFYPIEDNAQILHKLAEFLTTIDDATDRNRSFLFKYLVHHVSSQCWNVDLDERIRIDLLKIILGGRTVSSISDQIIHLVLGYDPSKSLSEIISEDVRKMNHLDPTIKNHAFSIPRSQWLEKIFSTKNDNDHLLYLDRLRHLGCIASPLI